MADADRVRWDAKYAERSGRANDPPSDWLVAHLSTLGRGGHALDLACGTGGNALLLASRGFRVTAVDISAVGIAIGKKVAGPLPIDWVVADLDDYSPTPAAYDVVLAIRFFDRRRLREWVAAALKPGGLFVGEACNANSEITNPDYRIEPGEWGTLLANVEIVAIDETGPTSRVVARKTR